MTLPSIKVPGGREIPERDPYCEDCQHQWFTPHVHRDGSGRCMSSDNHKVYIQTMQYGIAHCTCPNGRNTDDAHEPRCYHVRNYRTILIDVRNGTRKFPPKPQPKLEDFFQ